MEEISIMAKSSTTKSAKKRVKVKTLPAKTKTLTAKEKKKVKGAGNTVFVSGASGGVWKTTNF